MKDSLKKKRDELAEIQLNTFYKSMPFGFPNNATKHIKPDFIAGFDACHSLMEDEVRGLVDALKQIADDSWFKNSFVPSEDLQTRRLILIDRINTVRAIAIEAMRSQAEGEK